MMEIFFEIFEVFKDWLAYIGSASIVGGAFYLRQKSYAPDIASFATTTGIGFTFLGIVIAVHSLSGLGESDIKSELDKLLTGIYVAFVPSIAGVIVAVITHVKPSWFPSPPIDEKTKPSGVDEQILQEIQRLNKNITGSGETSLITRLEKFQLAVTEKQEDLVKEFQGLSKQIADKIIDALSESMKELNQKLGEQFGDNFGRFADVIPKLLEWQENYRKTIEDTQEQLQAQSTHLQEMINTLGSSSEAFAGIAGHIENISNFASNLKAKTDDLIVGLTSAADSIEKIRVDSGKLQSAAEQFSNVMQSQVAHTEKQNQLLNEIVATMGKAADAVKDAADNVGEIGKTNEQLRKHVDSMRDAMRTVSSLRGGVEEFAAALPQKATAIEKSMQDITDATLKQLASNLRGISEALVNDYMAVHNAIRQIREHHERKK